MLQAIVGRASHDYRSDENRLFQVDAGFNLTDNTEQCGTCASGKYMPVVLGKSISCVRK